MLAWTERHATRAVIVALVAAFLVHEFSAMLFACSADAYVITDVVSMAPDVPGPIAELHVRDNQTVAAGDTLLVIDPRPFAIALASARAALDLAQRQPALAEQAVAETEADIASRQAWLTDAQAIVSRTATLARDQLAPQQRPDDVRRDEPVAEAGLRRAQVVALVARR